MKKLILIFTIFISFISCITERKVSEKIKLYPEKYCKFCPETSIHTTDTIVKIDTVKFAEIDTSFIGSFIDLAVFKAQIKCDSLNRVQLDSLRFASKKGSGFIYIKDNKLIGQFKSKHDSLIIINKKLTETITINKNIIDSLKLTKNSIQIKKEIPFWIFIIFGFLGAIIIYLFFRKK